MPSNWIKSVLVSSTCSNNSEKVSKVEGSCQKKGKEAYPFESEQALVGSNDVLGVHAVRDLLSSSRDLGRSVGAQESEQLLRLAVAENGLNLRSVERSDMTTSADHEGKDIVGAG